MTQRNPMNERYLNDKPEGKTRKSAASAKPVAAAASSVRMESTKPQKKGFFNRKKTDDETDKSSKKEQKATPQEQEKLDRKAARKRKRAIANFVPDTEEFQRINEKRLIYSAVGFAGMIVAIGFAFLLPEFGVVSLVLMVAAWIMFYMGVRIDTKELRPLREAGYEKEQRRLAKEAEKAARAEREAERAARKAQEKYKGKGRK